MTRESLYVASSRGRAGTHWYAVTDHLLDATSDHEPDSPATAHEMLGRVIARSGSEDSATATIEATQREATSLPTLIARYQHAWQQASRDSLRAAAEGILPAPAAQRLITEPGAGKLAAVLATAAGRGADPAQLLRAVLDLDELTNVRSPALVLASRIDDYSSTLGVPRRRSMGSPLPWLEAPEVGHVAWTAYLHSRAKLIASRARELGSLTDCYREQYHFGHLHPGDLGEQPQPGTARRAAYDAATYDRDCQTRVLATNGYKPSQPRRAAPWLDGERPPSLRY